MKIPGGTRIKKIGIQDVTAVGLIRYIRVDFPGIKSPQKYLVPTTHSLHGTEVGSGVIATSMIDVDIPVPPGVAEVTFYVIGDQATQTVYVGAVWVGP